MMFGKTLFFVLLLAGVAVTPYLLSDHTWIGRIEEWLAPSATESPSEEPVDNAPQPAETVTRTVASQTYGPLGGRPHRTLMAQSSGLATPTPPSTTETDRIELPLPHILSFQATPEWITQNWQSVTSCVGELDLRGWRVPYFRHLPNDDFAGSVTYYFDRARNVQRIVLHGYTSDASEIVQVATSHYSMRPIHSPEGDLYLASFQQQPVGGLHVKFAPLLNSKQRNKQCEVLLELNRRNTEYGMSHEFNELVRRNQEANYLLTPIPERSY